LGGGFLDFLHDKRKQSRASQEHGKVDHFEKHIFLIYNLHPI
jgi:hypothetical protein